jgi:lipopolysaccharide/colanic/teichoic acid biosynthesis glycosyltransferase
VGAFFALALAAPFMFAFGIAIRLSSPGPILFRQLRSGLNGKPFTMYKFRSMVTNAEQLKHELAVLNEMDGPVFKVTNDPRVTRFGRFLRRYSFDELPQLWNVLRGEMSLVGPRPLPVDEVRRFDDLAHRRRLSVKPGLTCLWQISGRNNVTDFKDWVRLDLEYIDNWSIWLDFKILLQTIPIVPRAPAPSSAVKRSTQQFSFWKNRHESRVSGETSDWQTECRMPKETRSPVSEPAFNLHLRPNDAGKKKLPETPVAVQEATHLGGYRWRRLFGFSPG